MKKEDPKPWLLKKLVLPQYTDYAGFMWHGAYVNWLEEARISALTQVGISYSELSNEGYEMPLVEINIKYINSLHHGDTVFLESYLLPKKGAKLPWKTIFRKNNNQVAAESIVNLVIIKISAKGNRIVRDIPSHITKALQDLREGPINII